jgi:hypothetical protein
VGALAGLTAFVWRLGGAALGLGAVIALIYWPCNYLGWLFERDPYDGARAGACPACKSPNRIWPWSG